MHPQSRPHDTTAEPAADRDGRIEALLVEGLDLYFAGHYEEAVHLWTRVLFLDRSHARARAYIDRARTAIAERQRRADEWLQKSEEMLASGQPEAARALLARVVEAAGDDEAASAVRVRLERMERAFAARDAAVARPRSPLEPVPGWHWPRRTGAVVTLGAAMSAGLLLVAIAAGPFADGWLGLGGGRNELVTAGAPTRWPALSADEAALVRARTFYTRGRPAEALHALDRVRPDSPERAAADLLRVELQQLLLATSRQAPASPGGR